GMEREDDERWIDSESEEGEGRDGLDRGGVARGGWDGDGDDDVIPPRPRGRLLRPVPLALIALIIAAAGFLGGVEAQKGSEGGSGAAAGGFPGGNLPSFAKGGEGGASEGASAEGSEAGGESATG